VRCSCGKFVPVSGEGEGEGLAASAGKSERGPKAAGPPLWQQTRFRLLVVAGCFVAVCGLMAFLLLLAIVLHRPSQHDAHDAVVAKQESRTGDGADTDDGADEDGAETVSEAKTAAGEGPEPLRKAFDALGSREKLAAIKVIQIRGKAHFQQAPNVNTVALTWQSTQRFKYVETNGTMGFEIGFVLKGDTGWAWMGKMLKPLDKSAAVEQRLFAYTLSMSNLLPLKGKGYELVKGANVNVRGRDCYTIRVKFAGRPDMVFYLDETTHLLAKAAFRGRLMGGGPYQAGEIDFECYYGNYKVTNGVNHWWQYEQFRNGSRYAELNLDNIEFYAKVQSKHFAVPGS
jgi:hypothetical protein